MASPSPLVPAFCGLLPHPPIVVPAVAGARLEDCRRTTEACRALARRLVAAAPRRLLLVSPHAPRARGALGVLAGPRLAGDLGVFGAPRERVDLPWDEEAARALAAAARAAGLSTRDVPAGPLDHGALVPLWFLAEAGWDGPTTVVSPPREADPDELEALGRAVGRALASLEGRAALVASGDGTHRALPGAPAGFHPRAVELDRALVALVEAGRLAEIPRIDPALRALAAEDTVESATLVGAAIGHRARGAEALSYEHPFGVGYLVAVLHDGGDEGGDERLPCLAAVAREAIRARLEGRAPRLGGPGDGGARRAGVFVTLRDAAGALRGCVGSIEPTCADLVGEVADRAIAAALHDPRFPPLSVAELEVLSIEVSVLGACEPVASLAELDPARFGVVVRDDDGRAGVLLPGIAGIGTAADQVRLAARKAGLGPDATVRLLRFAIVEKVLEKVVETVAEESAAAAEPARRSAGRPPRGEAAP